MKKRVLVVFGGSSSEYEVSLQSAAAVLQGINRAKYRPHLLGIGREGQWLYYSGEEERIEADTWNSPASCTRAAFSAEPGEKGLWLLTGGAPEFVALDVVFPVLHGRHGEDGTLQGLLELCGLPFVGSGSLAGALCMEKDIAHRLAESAGVACPKAIALYAGGESAKKLQDKLCRAMEGTAFPWFVKPAAEGSSFGVSRVEHRGELGAALDKAFAYGEKILVEEGICGFEAGCAVLGNGQPQTGRVDAIRLEKGFFDYHEKYTLKTAKILVPAPIAQKKEAEICGKAKTLYRLFGCKGLARIDFFVEAGGRVLFNEVNTMPGMTAHSRYPAMMKAAGLEFARLIDRLLELALENA